jgi:hypothetical protein
MKTTPNRHSQPRKSLRILITPTRSLHQHTRKRRSNQHRKTHHRKYLSQSRPGFTQIRRKRAERRRKHPLDTSARDTVEDRPDVETGAGIHSDPAECEERGDDYGGDNGVERSEITVCEVTGKDSADNSYCVHADEEVDGFSVWQTNDGACE